MRNRRPAENPEEITRRTFAGSLVAATALGLLPAAQAQSISGSLPHEASQPAFDPGAKPDDLSAADWEEVQAKLANLLRVYGPRLSADEKRRAAVILKMNQYMLASIRAFEVQNGDPSACTLRLCNDRQKPAGVPAQ